MSHTFDKERTHKRFALTGRSVIVDGRVEAVRRDLADVRLAQRVFAPHYAQGIARVAQVGSPILDGPTAVAAALSEILPGERFDMLEESNGYAWGICCADGCVGYVALSALGDTATRSADSAADAYASDLVSIAEGLIGVAAKPGGRSPAGVDAGGMMFLVLARAGVRVPRFTDLQAAQVGESLTDNAAPARGDLLFFQDHSAILRDPETAIHVGAELVETRPLEQLVSEFGPPVAHRRIV